MARVERISVPMPGQRPERRARGISGKLTAVVIAGTVAAGGVGSCVYINRLLEEPNGNVPPPITGEATPSPTPTLEITFTPSPIPEVTPTPEPTPTPLPTPTESPSQNPETPPPIESVEVKGGITKIMIYHEPPYYFLSVLGGTVVAVEEKNPETGDQWFAISTEGDRIEKENCRIEKFGSGDGTTHKINACDYSGATFWIKVKPQSKIGESHGGTYILLGNGPDALAPYLNIGTKLRTIPLILGGYNKYDKDLFLTSEEIQMNADSFKKLNSSVGENYPRSKKIFQFATQVIVAAP